jgi:hypothetical protein
VTAGRVGTNGLGNHKHNDLLAIDVHLEGEDVLVDAGTFVYSADPAARNAFRSTLMHNTVAIDGLEQNDIPAHLFALGRNATPALRAWEPGPDGGRVIVEHDGYARLPRPVIHRRAVSLGPQGVSVDDLFEMRATDTHRFTWTFLFAAGSTLRGSADGWTVRLASGSEVRLTWPADSGGNRLGIVPEPAVGFVSPRYGVRHEAPLLRWALSGYVSAVHFRLER